MTANEKQAADKTHERLLYEGAKGHQPKTDRDLDEWLATPEGKAATAYDVTSLSPWGEKGRS